MFNTKPSNLVLWLFVTLGFAQFAWYYTRLPDEVATHFGPNGLPDAWGAKEELVIAGVVAYLVVLVLLLPWVWLIDRIPDALINLPHKEHWLAPQHRTATHAYLKDQLQWFGAATVLLLNLVFNMGLAANLEPNPSVDATLFFWILGVYLLFVLVWTCLMLLRFAKPPAI